MKSFRFSTFFVFVALFGICLSISQMAFAKEPKWMGKSWEDDKYFYFSGISAQSSNLHDAKERAYMDAVRKAAEYVGFTINDSTNRRIDSTTESNDINSNTSTLVENTYLAQGTIKEFKYTKEKNKKYTGYVLIVYDKKAIEQEKKRKEAIEKEKQARILARKKIGTITINAAQPSLQTLVPKMKQILTKIGYVVGDNGLGANVKLIEESFEPTGGNRNNIMCIINIEFELNGAVQTFEAIGYGQTEEQASRKARDRWLEVFQTTFDKDLF